MAKEAPRTLEEQERRMINLAMDLAERQLREGTASSQTINHFLQLGDSMQDLRRQTAESRISLEAAKIESINQQRVSDERASKAVEALKIYAGRFGLEELPDGFIP